VSVKHTRVKGMMRNNNEVRQLYKMHCLLSTLDFYSLSESAFVLLNHDCLHHQHTCTENMLKCIHLLFAGPSGE